MTLRPLPVRLATALSLASLLVLGPITTAQDAPSARGDDPTHAPTHALVHVVLDGPADARALAGLGVDLHCGASVVSEDGRTLQVVIPTAVLDALEGTGLAHRVVVEDLGAQIQARLATQAPAPDAPAPPGGPNLVPPFGQGSLAGMYTWSEVESVLDQLTSAHPAITTDKVSLGSTSEGRPIWMIKISDNPDVDENEPEVRVDAMHHAREPQSMMSTIWFVSWLLEGYGTDPLATYLVDEREIYVIPVVNPDGYVHNEVTEPGGGGLWRKNRFDNGDGTTGIDLNRNYPYEWGYDDFGSSPFTDSITYRGSAPASELETQHMLAFIGQRDFVAALSNHSASNVWLRPWGYEGTAPLPNQAAYDEIGDAATPDGWPHDTGLATLGYPANGVTNDTDQGTHGIMSWTPEIGASGDGFWPDLDRIIPLAEEVMPGMAATVAAAGAWLRVLDVTEAEEGDGDGFVEAGETLAVSVDLRNSGLAGTGTLVDLALSSSSPFATVTTGAASLPAMASFSSADNHGNPLRLTVDAGTPAGTVIDYELTVTAEGYGQVLAGTFVAGKSRPFLVDDVEVDLGWQAGVTGDTATTGVWERGDPIGISNGTGELQPEDDHTTGGTQAFLTGNGSTSAGGDDVDDGHTTLISPAFDLSGTGPATLSYARYYALQSVFDDQFEVSISNDDGQAWTALETLTTNENTWQTPSFVVSDVLPQTDRMRLRFVAGDDPNNSLVEALVDDLRIDLFDAEPRINLYGEPAADQDVRFGVSADAGSSFLWLFSGGTANLQVGQIQGPLLLDPGDLYELFSGTVPAGDLSAVDLTVPDDPALSGFVLYFQAFVNQGGVKHLTNRARLQFL
jgi:hypothetical protein